MDLVEIRKAMKLPDGSWVRMRTIRRATGAKPRFDEDLYTHTVSARRKGREVGFLQVRNQDSMTPGVIHMVRTADAHQRKGIATEMYRTAKKRGLNPLHNPGSQSRSGRKWAQSVGD